MVSTRWRCRLTRPTKSSDNRAIRPTYHFRHPAGSPPGESDGAKKYPSPPPTADPFDRAVLHAPAIAKADALPEAVPAPVATSPAVSMCGFFVAAAVVIAASAPIAKTVVIVASTAVSIATVKLYAIAKISRISKGRCNSRCKQHAACEQSGRKKTLHGLILLVAPNRLGRSGFVDESGVRPSKPRRP